MSKALRYIGDQFAPRRYTVGIGCCDFTADEVAGLLADGRDVDGAVAGGSHAWVGGEPPAEVVKVTRQLARQARAEAAAADPAPQG